MLVALDIQRAMRKSHIMIYSVSGLMHFHTVSKKSRFSKKKSYWTQNTCPDFLHKIFFWNISHSTKNWARYDTRCMLVFMQSTGYSCHNLMKLEFSVHIREKYSDIKIYEKQSCYMRTGRWTDMTNLIVSFHGFANAPENYRTVNS
jgi:hypothetical protein